MDNLIYLFTYKGLLRVTALPANIIMIAGIDSFTSNFRRKEGVPGERGCKGG